MGEGLFTRNGVPVLSQGLRATPVELLQMGVVMGERVSARRGGWGQLLTPSWWQGEPRSKHPVGAVLLGVGARSWFSCYFGFYTWGTQRRGDIREGGEEGGFFLSKFRIFFGGFFFFLDVTFRTSSINFFWRKEKKPTKPLDAATHLRTKCF